jgi:hypothetical protein
MGLIRNCKDMLLWYFSSHHKTNHCIYVRCVYHILLITNMFQITIMTIIMVTYKNIRNQNSLSICKSEPLHVTKNASDCAVTEYQLYLPPKSDKIHIFLKTSNNWVYCFIQFYVHPVFPIEVIQVYIHPVFSIEVCITRQCDLMTHINYIKQYTQFLYVFKTLEFYQFF